MNTPISPEDYAEPRCLLNEEHYGSAPPVIPVPQQRIIDKLDEYMSHRDYAGAERHLRYWLTEAEQGRDLRGKLFICNELVGHYRKTGQKENAFRFAEDALHLLSELNYKGSATSGTTLVNAATAYNAFGESEKAMTLFEQAQADLESDPRTDPSLLGGLYNNMALACKDLNRFDEAFSFFGRAMELMAKVPGGCLEQAVTCLNIADTLTQERGADASADKVSALLDRAWTLLQDPSVPRDGYYAFVCEKCAPGFADYGRISEAEELSKRAEASYERT